MILLIKLSNMLHRKSKKRSVRKGQIAIEYLYTYGWILIVVILGLLILWQMGAFKLPTSKRDYLGFSEVLPSDWGVYHTNEIYLRLVNYAGVGVRIPTEGVNLTMGIVNCTPAPSSPMIIDPGDENSKLLTLDCSTPNKISDIYRPGDYYEADVVISYINEKTGKLHKSVGKIFGPVEEYFIEVTTTTTTMTTTTTSTTTTILSTGHISVLQAFPRNGSEI